MAQKSRKQRIAKRHRRVRVKIRGTAERPRLAVYRSNKHIYAQLIDDDACRTLCSVSTLSPKFKDALVGVNGKARAKAVGESVGELAKERNVTAVIFDRGGFTFAGQIKALADAARAKGLDF